MKDRLSALMDGELDDKSAAEVIEALGRDHEAVRTWRTYQLISDALRESRLLSADFTARFSERSPRSRRSSRHGSCKGIAQVVRAVGGRASRRSRS